MKKQLLSRKRLTASFYSLLMILLYINVGWGQTTSTLPVYDGFDYAIGTGATGLLGNSNLANANGQGPWSTLAAVSADDTAIIAGPTWATGPGLSAGIQSPTGNALSILGSGADPQLNFTPLTGSFGTVYASTLMKVTSVSGITADLGDGTFFFSFGYVNPLTPTSTSYQSAVYIRRNGTGYNLGINKGTTAADTVWDPTIFAIDQEVFIVISYSDTFYPKLWINPVINGIEPTATQTNPTPRATSRPDRLRITQTAGATTPAIILDEIRVGMSWVDVTGAGVVIPITNYYYKGTGSLASESSWGSNTDGSGSSPANFTSDKQHFILSNTTAVATDAPWTVSGTDSKILLGDLTLPAVTLTVADTFPITGIIDIPAASSGSNSLVLQDATTFPTFGTLHSTSEVHFQVTPTAINLSSNFGKLFIDGNSIMNLGAAGLTSTATIQTSLTVASGSTLSIASTGSSYIYLNSGAVATISGTFKTSRQGGFVSFSNTTVNTTSATYTALQFKDAEIPSTSLLLAGGTIEFNRGNSATVQAITPRSDYNNLTFSDGGTAAANKSLASSLTVSGTLTLYHRWGSTITGAGSMNMGNGATIVRTAGDFSTAPIFGTSVNVNYNGSTAISSGLEIPSDTSILNNLTINNAGGVTLTTPTAVNNKLSVTSGTLTTGDFLTLKSNASKTAFVGPVGGSIAGNVTTERYIPAGQRAYRFLSSPVSTTTFIDTNWQVGTHITGVGGATNGFDATTGNNASMFTYNNTTPAWIAVTNTNATVLASGVPYLTYIRGSRAASLAIAPIGSIPSDAATLSATGTLTTGDVLVNGLNETANGFSAVGNPYQAQVDMQAVLAASTNLNTGFYYVVDPSLGTKGAYLTVDVTALASAHISQYLQPGQACFVNTLAAGPASLTFTEANKSEAAAQTTIFKTKNTAMPTIGLSLYDSASNRLDVLKIAFDASETNDVNQNDASKMNNFDESMASSNNGKLLSIEKRAMPTDSDEIPLNITKYRGTSYTIKAEGSGLTGSAPYLLDQFENKTIEIPQDGSVDYAYTVDAAIPASIAADRFKLIYAKTLKTIDNAVTSFALYPNPSKTNSFSVAIPQSSTKASLTVSNMLGQKLYSQNDLQSGTTVNVTASNIKTAEVYLVSLTSEGKTTTTKWIVE